MIETNTFIHPEDLDYVDRADEIIFAVNRALKMGGYVRRGQYLHICDNQNQPTEEKVWFEVYTIVLPYISNTNLTGDVMSRLQTIATADKWCGISLEFSDVINESMFRLETIKGVGNVQISRSHRAPVGTTLVFLYYKPKDTK